ncbi:hypothetical protein NUU61_006409 [Penicillium alfredii]|uniref:BRCT domain-containing protein n=1 Tax=Penicillium alfredii TaxID=1506179 RepID=A0A9W9F0X5_9EURO|nr:uncharacterized protein NUU61_006409 [Penicillium alfredii]KAJ5091539.1 hypothetical protein NUU61_006409 [Penicillium alfredii]
MGKTFQKINVCCAGKFDQLGDKIPQWVRANGGQFSRNVDDRVTHLITTKEAFQQNVEAVQDAKKLRTVKIVSYDWLEDSLQSKTRRPKSENPYLLVNILEAEKQKRKLKSTQKNSNPTTRKRRFGSETYISSQHYHIISEADEDAYLNLLAKTRIHMDEGSGVFYTATLVRPYQTSSAKERYTLTVRLAYSIHFLARGQKLTSKHQIFESIAEPHTYSAFAKYSRVGKTTVDQLAPPHSSFDVTVAIFKKIFKTDPNGNRLPAHEGWYCLEVRDNLFANFLMAPPSVVIPGPGAAVRRTENVSSDDGEDAASSHLDSNGAKE